VRWCALLECHAAVPLRECHAAVERRAATTPRRESACEAAHEWVRDRECSRANVDYAARGEARADYVVDAQAVVSAHDPDAHAVW
jgi:hypothetical protein